MKRILTLVLVFASAALAQVSFTFAPPVTATAPGTTGTAFVKILNPATALAFPVALQFMLTVNPTDIVSTEFLPATELTTSQKQLACNQIAPGQTICVVWGLNVLPVANGNIASVKFTTGTNTAVVNTPVFLVDVSAVDKDGNKLTATGATSSILLTASPCDFNKDGKVDALDVANVNNQVIRIAACTNGDMNKDGKCDLLDTYREILSALPVLPGVTGSGMCRIGL